MQQFVRWGGFLLKTTKIQEIISTAWFALLVDKGDYFTAPEIIRSPYKTSIAELAEQWEHWGSRGAIELFFGTEQTTPWLLPVKKRWVMTIDVPINPMSCTFQPTLFTEKIWRSSLPYVFWLHLFCAIPDLLFTRGRLLATFPYCTWSGEGLCRLARLWDLFILQPLQFKAHVALEYLGNEMGPIFSWLSRLHQC